MIYTIEVNDTNYTIVKYTTKVKMRYKMLKVSIGKTSKISKLR